MLLGLFLILLVMFKCRHMEKHPRAPWVQAKRSLYEAIPTILTPVIVLGGIYGNLMTPTEAAAVAGIWAILVGFFIYRELTLSGLLTALKDTATVTAMIFIIIAMAVFLSTTLNYTRVPHQIIELLTSWGVSPLLFLLSVAVTCVFLGTFMEVVPILYLTIPIFAPVAKTMGLEMVHLYIVTSAFVGTGLITPPVCVGAYTAAAVAKEEATLVVRALFPSFFIVFMIYGLAVILFPQLSTWLPSIVSK